LVAASVASPVGRPYIGETGVNARQHLSALSDVVRAKQFLSAVIPCTAHPYENGRPSMVLTLAFRNLFHDRVRLVVTVVGILFSIVLVAVQLGLYLGARKMIVGMI
jgi:hypothetical protein